MLKKLYLFCIPLLCSLHISASVNPTGQEFSIFSTLKTTEQILGQVNLTVGANGELSIPIEDVDWALAKVLPQETIDKIKAGSQNGKMTDAAFKAAGFPISFDTQTFELLIDIPVEQNRVSTISLEKDNANVAQSEPSQFNGYLNAYLRASHNSSTSGSSDNFSQSHRFKAGLNTGAANLIYEAEFLDSNNFDAEFNRIFTQFSYDLPEQGTRFLLGDIVTPTTDFQNGGDIAGIGIVRDFSDIPTRNLRPTATQQFTLRRTSDVNVIVDGIVIQRITLPAGRYDINNIPLATGRNDVELLIEDEAGNREIISFSIAIDNNLIKQGEYEYALTAGVPSSIEGNKLTYDDSSILTTAFLEYGFRPSWTLGLNGQFYNGSSQFGLLSLNAWRFGTTELLYSHSNHNINGLGDVVRLTYASPQEFQDRYHFQVNAQYEYFTPSYAQVDSELLDRNTVIQHNARLSLSSNFYQRYNTSLDVNFRQAYYTDEDSWSVSTSLSGPIWLTGATFGINLRYLNDFDQEGNFDVITNVSYSPRVAHRFLGRYQSSDNAYALDYSYRNRTNTVGGVELSANVETNEDDELLFNGDANYTANRAEIGIEHDTRFESLDSSEKANETSVTLDTAIAFSGKNIAIGRPVNESFAVVSPNKNLSNNVVKIQPDSKGNAQVISTKSRNVLVNSLAPYSNQTISYGVDDLPVGYDLGPGLFSVYPIKGQAYQLAIGTDAAHTLIATILDRKTNSPIAFVAGKAYKVKDPAIKRNFFTTKKGRVAISGMSSGEWILELDTKPVKQVKVTLIENENMLDQKGAIYVDE